MLDIDNDITLYNIKKWVCIYTRDKMCQKYGSLKPLAVRPTCWPDKMSLSGRSGGLRISWWSRWGVGLCGSWRAPMGGR